MSSTNTQETVAVVVRDENDRPHAVLLEAGVNLQHGTGLYATPLSAEPSDEEIGALAAEFDTSGTSEGDAMGFDHVGFARALLFRYSAAPVSAEPVKNHGE